METNQGSPPLQRKDTGSGTPKTNEISVQAGASVSSPIPLARSTGSQTQMCTPPNSPAKTNLFGSSPAQHNTFTPPGTVYTNRHNIDTDVEFPDFTQPDEMSSLTLIIEETKLYVHREVLAAWSPVFKSMFIRDFIEKEANEIELPGKKVDDFVELLHCMYPPIKPITDSNVHQLLPLIEEYQIAEVKKKCEEYLLTKPGSMEILILAQTYGLPNLLAKGIEFARGKSFTELKQNPHFHSLDPVNLIEILQLRVEDLESILETSKRAASERDARLYGVINDLASGYGNFCPDCKSRRVNDSCTNCLKMFREKVRMKCEEAKNLRSHHSPRAGSGAGPF